MFLDYPLCLPNPDKFHAALITLIVLRWLATAANLQELNIDDNLIGDMGGREILHGLQTRKEGN